MTIQEFKTEVEEDYQTVLDVLVEKINGLTQIVHSKYRDEEAKIRFDRSSDLGTEWDLL